MNETTKSLIFVGVAALAAIGAFFARPTAGTMPPSGTEVKTLFESFTDPALAKSLEIVRPDEASATIQTFKVQQENGLWVIPSSGNYRADARDRVKNAATALIGREVIGVATDKQTEHELYGVVQPDASKASVNLKGVGMLISVKDASGKDLASLIVGKSLKGQPDQHFVRVPTQDRVYVAKISPDQISTKFEDWIEKDLLNLNPLEVSSIEIKNYAVIAARDSTGRVGRQRVPRADLTINYDDKLSKWTPGPMTVYSIQQKKSNDAPLTEQEELDAAKLDELRTGLDNLQIAGVRRKPAGFTADLKADKSFVDNEESLQSLMSKGFFPGETSPGVIEIFGTDGELRIFTKDGVQYDLRFGDIDQGEQGKATAELNRYMLVSVKLNEAAIPQPVLIPEPNGPEPPKNKNKEGEKKEGEAQEGEKSDDQQKPDDVAAEAKFKQELERIKKENERMQSEYTQKLNKAKNRVKELNYRFADWYYLVSNDTFKKLSLTRADIVKETAAAVKEGFGIDAFRALQREGVKPPPPKMPAPPTGGFPGGGFPPGGGRPFGQQ